MIEFHKYKEELQGCLDSEISQNQQWVSNMPNISDSEIFIRNSYPRSAIKSLILDGDINGIIILVYQVILILMMKPILDIHY